MPVCVVKLCKNNTTRNKKATGITYHQFPAEPNILACWTEIIQNSRMDIFWRPGKRTVICSAHFNENDFYFTKCGFKRLCKGAFPKNALYLSSTPDNPPIKRLAITKPSISDVEIPVIPTKGLKRPASPGPLLVKRAYNCTNENERSYMTYSQMVHAPSLADKHNDSNEKLLEVTVNGCDNDTVLNVIKVKEELPEHSNFRCRVCHNEISGFRYTCLQCVDWDMCTACEARGEHAAHYVLRLPAPTTYLKHEAVLSAIRQHLDDLLKLNDEMRGVLIKKENIDEVQEELDQDEADLSAESNEQSVPQVDVRHKTITISIPPALPVDVPTRNIPPHYNEQSVVNPETTITQKVKEEPTDCPLLIDETLPKTNLETIFIKTEPIFYGE